MNLSEDKIYQRGNLALLDHPATAFLCSTRCSGEKVLEFYEWARRQCDEKTTIISGFHTPVEKDILTILVRRGANIIWVPARDLPKITPKEFRPAEKENRLLILTPFAPGKPSRPTRASCETRNRFVIKMAQAGIVAYADPESRLAQLLQ